MSVKADVANLKVLERDIAAASTPEAVVEIQAKLDGFETYMREAGMYDTKAIRPVNEARMRARWKLGQLLAAAERGAGPGRGKKEQAAPVSFKALIARLGIKLDAAIELQRLGAMPEAELEKAFAQARTRDVLNTVSALVEWARPWWYKANRERKHAAIAESASAANQGAKIIEGEGGAVLQAITGPFPLIYADPPWQFSTYSEKGLERTPDQHYPTLSDEEIQTFLIEGQTVEQIAHKQAALFLWCTSSNIERALRIMRAWGFEFSASAVWVKDKVGLGMVFRNWHEVLLYGKRGAMPGPQYQPPSVFRYPRGVHSAKPPEIRKEIEKMFPSFDESTRLELFPGVPTVEGWTTYGLPHRDTDG